MQKTIIQSIRNIIQLEFRTMFSNSSVILVLILAPLIYATVYSTAYAKQIAINIPIAVVDDCQSTKSQNFTELLSASENLQVTYSTTDILCAQTLLNNRKIYGIVHIPRDFSTSILRAEQATISLYCDASYFLMYRQVFQGVMSVISTINSQGDNSIITLKSHTLFNSDLGYGTFIMPAILIVIIQQTTLMGIGIVGGIWRKRRLYNNRSSAAIVIGKAVVYCLICAAIACYILGIHYKLFNYPQKGAITTAIAIIAPYIISFTMLGITLSTIFHKAESAILTLMWTSIPVLLLSGASLPPDAIPSRLFILGKIFPSSSAVPAYIRIQSMGATLSDVSIEVTTLWALSVIYTTTAIIATKKMSARDNYQNPNTRLAMNANHTLLRKNGSL